MQTSAIITMIKEQAPNWSRASILELVNQLHWIVLAKPMGQTYALSSTTGIDYEFTTTVGTYSYDISTDNGFPYDGYRVIKVYTGTPLTGENEVTGIHSYDATYDNTASIVFSSNPNGSAFYVRYIKKPTNISAETVNLDLPEVHHFDFVQGVLGMIELATSGQSRRWERFEVQRLPKIWASLSSGVRFEQDNTFYNTPSRGY